MFKYVIMLVLVIYCALFANNNSDKAALAEVKTVAEEGYKKILSSFDAVDRARFQLNETDLVEEAELGEPFKLQIMDSKVIRNYADYSDKKVQDLTVAIENYMVAVKFNGVSKLFVTVCKFKGKSSYEIASIGDVPLAQKIDQVSASWNRSNTEVVLIQNPESHAYMFHVPSVDETNLTIIDVRSSSRKDYRSLSTVGNAVATLLTHLPKTPMYGGSNE